jgi:hypothetical protein
MSAGFVLAVGVDFAESYRGREVDTRFGALTRRGFRSLSPEEQERRMSMFVDRRKLDDGFPDE